MPVLTSSRVGDIPIEDIDAAFSASAAAVQEMQSLGADLAAPLLEYGEAQQGMEMFLPLRAVWRKGLKAKDLTHCGPPCHPQASLCTT